MGAFTNTLQELFDVNTVEEALPRFAEIGLDKYPIFDENYRNILNEKIIRRYWNREIGQESPEMFRFTMQRRMGEIMPLYNDLYQSQRLKYDPLSTMDIRTVADNETSHSESGSNLSTNEVDAGSRTVNSTTPQNQLSGNGDYADSMSDANSESRNTSSASTTGEGTQRAKVNSRTSGYQAVPADLLRKYRENIINVDLMVLNEISTLFMVVTATGSDKFNNGGGWYDFNFAW